MDEGRHVQGSGGAGAGVDSMAVRSAQDRMNARGA
jgi:hypothetical protein